MRKPLRNKSQAKQQVSHFVSQQSPVGGWNAVDALANMKPWVVSVLKRKIDGTNVGGCVMLSNRQIIEGVIEDVPGGVLVDGRFLSSAPTEATNYAALVPAVDKGPGRR